MPKSTTSKTTKGLGARYGSTVRKRASKVWTALRQVRRCPSCGSKRFKRASAGLWSCSKCGYVVAGGAYEP
ncbi:MAG: 50S ribosomal protein L37 [Nitrososphaeria archaeon]